MKRWFNLSLIFVLVAALSGCSRQAAVYNVDNAEISPVAGKLLSQVGVRDAIVRAGRALGWQMAESQPGRLLGTLQLRSNVAVIAIDYNTSRYSISLKESRNLDYRPETQTIESNYNLWVQNLQQKITANIRML